MLGFKRHGPRTIKHIYLDDAVRISISVVLKTTASGMLMSAVGSRANKPAVMLTFSRAHRLHSFFSLSLSLSPSLSPPRCEPLDSVQSERGVLSVHHLHRVKSKLHNGVFGPENRRFIKNHVLWRDHIVFSL